MPNAVSTTAATAMSDAIVMPDGGDRDRRVAQDVPLYHRNLATN